MGEKLAKVAATITGEGIKELSACWYLDLDGWHEVQHIGVSTDRPEHKVARDDSDDNPTGWLEKFLKDHPDVSVGDILSVMEEKEEK